MLKEEPCFDVSTETCFTQVASKHNSILPILVQEYWNIISCAPYAEGGCKCPVGKERCGATDHHKGWCASVCCDPKTEVSCWKLNSQFKFDVTACAPKEEGWRGCPCPEGQSRCGPDQTPSGLCSPICCDKSTQVYCFTTSWLDYDAYCVDIGEQC